MFNGVSDFGFIVCCGVIKKSVSFVLEKVLFWVKFFKFNEYICENEK